MCCLLPSSPRHRALSPCLLRTAVQKTLHGQVPCSLVDGKALAAIPGEQDIKPSLAPLAAPAQANGLVRQGAKRQGRLSSLPLAEKRACGQGSQPS